MQRVSLAWFVVISMAVALHGVACRDAQAQSGSVKVIFEKHNLLGVFAWDCSKPASKDNLYYITRLLDPDRVQRDEMGDPTTRTWVHDSRQGRGNRAQPGAAKR